MKHGPKNPHGNKRAVRLAAKFARQDASRCVCGDLAERVVA